MILPEHPYPREPASWGEMGYVFLLTLGIIFAAAGIYILLALFPVILAALPGALVAVVAVVIVLLVLTVWGAALTVLWPIATSARLLANLASLGLWVLWSFSPVVRPPRRDLKHHVLKAESGTQDGSLCDVCKKLIARSPLLTGTPFYLARRIEYHRHLPYGDLEQSSQSCHLCNLLLRSSWWDPMAYQAPFERQAPSQPSERSPLITKPKPEVVCIRQPLRSRPGLCYIGLKHTPRDQLLTVSTPDDTETPSISCEMQSPRALKRGTEWINFCTNKHEICGAGTSLGFSPTRLIYVERLEPTIKVRLIETADESIKPSGPFRYLALSHRWGTDRKFLKLTDETFAAFKTEIPFNKLPANFRHAIVITARLKTPYLWIDSLCIIQGNQADWLHEAANMGRIYANALCTISATGSSDPSGGCFAPRNPFLGDLVLHTGNATAPVIRSPITSDSKISPLFDRKVEEAPISTRGWTFQERALSQRILHFTPGMFLFECGTLLATEYYPGGVLYSKIEASEDVPTVQNNNNLSVLDYLDNAVSYIFYLLVNKPATITVTRPSLPGFIGMRRAFLVVSSRRFDWSQELDVVEFHILWMQVVAAYSQRELTDETDRLIALLGVCGGLWEQALGLNLLWVSNRPAEGRKEGAMVPTWSWAAASGPVSDVVTRVLRNEYGKFEFLGRPGDLKFLVEPESWRLSGATEHDEMVHSAVLEHPKARVMPTADAREISRFMDVKIPRSEQQSLFLLPLILIRGKRRKAVRGKLWEAARKALSVQENEREEYIEMHGIILRSVAKEGLYERVGYFFCEWCGPISSSWYGKVQSIRLV
ncbi:heterokaryon incompatibility protein-domain-containing protein [Hyaloscypha finlandica]|nr:heterokaryon incompatibility protein-domain-containing protein [Hyaloscypha finlandica]